MHGMQSREPIGRGKQSKGTIRSGKQSRGLIEVGNQSRGGPIWSDGKSREPVGSMQRPMQAVRFTWDLEKARSLGS